MPTELDFHNIDRDEAGKAEFPVEVAGEYRVHLSGAAFDKMKQHADTTSDVELCGVLVGDVCRDARGFFLLVTGAIEGEGANNYGSQVTFTHQTWNHINAVKDREHPKSRIVGWYHTHPGFGVFLSSMDSFIQENFFNQPYQVAVVIETKQDKLGCFAWVDGKCEPLRRLWIGDREVMLTAGDVDQFDPEAATAETKPSGTSAASWPRGIPALSGGYVLLMMGLLFLCGLFWGKSSAVGEAKRVFESEVYSLLEFAALNATAEKDFEDSRERLVAIRGHVEKGESDAAKTGIDELAGLMGSLQKLYGKRRSTFKRDMNRLMLSKKHLSERVESTARRQEELENYMAELMLMRVGDVLREAGARGFDGLSDEQRLEVRTYLDRAIRLSPAVKSAIQRALPGLLESMYPSPPDGPGGRRGAGGR